MIGIDILSVKKLEEKSDKFIENILISKKYVIIPMVIIKRFDLSNIYHYQLELTSLNI